MDTTSTNGTETLKFKLSKLKHTIRYFAYGTVSVGTCLTFMNHA
jgi:hypothetical protein